MIHKYRISTLSIILMFTISWNIHVNGLLANHLIHPARLVHWILPSAGRKNGAIKHIATVGIFIPYDRLIGCEYKPEFVWCYKFCVSVHLGKHFYSYTSQEVYRNGKIHETYFVNNFTSFINFKNSLYRINLLERLWASKLVLLIFL